MHDALDDHAIKLLLEQGFRLIEDALIEALETFGIEAERQKGYTGVWAADFKLASIGVAVYPVGWPL